jgi:hypothetical protein
VLIDIRTLYSVRVGVSREIYFGFFFQTKRETRLVSHMLKEKTATCAMIFDAARRCTHDDKRNHRLTQRNKSWVVAFTDQQSADRRARAIPSIAIATSSAVIIRLTLSILHS